MSNVRAALFLLLIIRGASAPAAAAPFPHVRTLHPALRAALEIGADRSPLFRQLLDRLNGSDLVVHVTYGEQLPQGVAGQLAFAVSAGGFRYVRVAIAPRLTGCDLVAIIGHELRHAVEVADESSVVDQRTMMMFYASTGLRRDWAPHETFDTATAVEAGNRIRREMLRASPDGRSR